MTSFASILAQIEHHRVLEFAHQPQGWSALVGLLTLAVLLYLVIYLYRREARSGASLKTRYVLAGLRCTVLIVLAIIWLQPVITTYHQQQQRATTLILADGSASMSLKDRYPDASIKREVKNALQKTSKHDPTEFTRAELVETLLNPAGQNLARQLAANNNIQLYQFGQSLKPIGPQNPTTQETTPLENPQSQNLTQHHNINNFKLNADAPVTDVGQAIRHAVDAQAGTPLAGVIVFSDGCFNHGEPVETVGRYARSRKIPIYTVGIGDPSPPRNLSVSTLEAPTNVFIRDPFEITADLQARGMNQANVKVELLRRRSGSDQPVLLESKNISLPTGRSKHRITFTQQLQAAGQTRFLFRVTPLPGETLSQDNVKEITVHALDNKIKVLIVAGGPSWDYRLLARLLQRDKTIELSCWLQSADTTAVRDGNKVIDHLPTSREELLNYDCVILMDPQAGNFLSSWADHIESLVTANGGGFLYVAGRKNTPRFTHEPDARSLLDLLPVTFDPSEADLLINELGHFQETNWALKVPPDAANHAVLALTDNPQLNRRIWAQLPGLYWHYPVQREKPVATVLLRHSNPRMRNSYGGHVLLATQFLGTGHTGYLAFNSTWRWRRSGEQYFNRFWIKLLRHLVEGRLLSGQKRGTLQADRENYRVGQPVRLKARLLDQRNRPFDTEQVEAAVLQNNQTIETMQLKKQTNRPGWYAGHFIPTSQGDYRIRIELPDASEDEPISIQTEISIGRANLEFQNPRMNLAALQQLANASAGGKYLNIIEARHLVSLIPDQTTSLVVASRPVSLWDRWWTFALLVSLLTTEWIIRKRVRLL